ncbi:MAG: hypothetical protein AB8G16_14885 [Gammaproteobacteria bacterium]
MSAAATFVVLAGVGLGISLTRTAWQPLQRVVLKRAAFLLVLGLANTLVFDADIIHYRA